MAMNRQQRGHLLLLVLVTRTCTSASSSDVSPETDTCLHARTEREGSMERSRERSKEGEIGWGVGWSTQGRREETDKYTHTCTHTCTYRHTDTQKGVSVVQKTQTRFTQHIAAAPLQQQPRVFG